MRVRNVRLKSLVMVAAVALLLGVGITVARQSGIFDEAGRVTALENAWSHAMEAKDTKAMGMLLADSLIAVDIDGSKSDKAE